MRGNTPGAPPLHRLPVLTEVVQLSEHERSHEPVLSEWPDQDFLPEPGLALVSGPQWNEPEPEQPLVQAVAPVAEVAAVAAPVAAPARSLTPAAVWAAATQAPSVAPLGADGGRTAPLRPGIPPTLHTVVMPASASEPAPPVLPLHSEVRSTPTVSPAPAAPPSFASSWWTEDDEAAFPPPSIRAGVQPVQPEGWAAAVPSYTSPLAAAYPSAPVPPMVVLQPPPAPPPPPPLPTEEQLVQRVLSGLDRQLSLVFEQQLVEIVVPALARASEALVSELRTELAQTLHDMVQHAVAVELARHAPSRK